MKIEIYDALGRRVRELQPMSFRPVGKYHLGWDGLNGRGCPVASGVYFIWLDAEDGLLEFRKLVLAR